MAMLGLTACSVKSTEDQHQLHLQEEFKHLFCPEFSFIWCFSIKHWVIPYSALSLESERMFQAKLNRN